MLQTPYYLVDEQKLINNLEKIQQLQELSNAKALLALKCFATWSTFDLINKYINGATTSSLYEVKLSKLFFEETHAYSVAWTDNEIDEVVELSQKIIFNSISQLQRFHSKTKNKPIGLRINPSVSYSSFDLADPARKFSRLGVVQKHEILENLPLLDGAMFHFNCENSDFLAFKKMLEVISHEYCDILTKLKWVSLGGGIHFSANNYPLTELAALLKNFSIKHNVQIYLEPGEATITNAAQLMVSVIDLTKNEKNIAVVDASIEAHMLDLLTYNLNAKINTKGYHHYIISGKSCLAGDIFGEYGFDKPLKIGDRIAIEDAAGYTMVKKNWFNGLNMPSIAIKKQNNEIELVREFTFDDYKNSLS